MANITDIQQLINNKADSKLQKHLSDISNALTTGIGYKLLKDISINVGTAEKPKNIGLAWILSSSGLQDKIIETHTERYREDEAKEFLSKVESLREDVDALLDNQNF